MGEKILVEVSKINIMRFQRLYCVESDFSVSFGPKPKLNNNKKGRAGEGAKD